MENHLITNYPPSTCAYKFIYTLIHIYIYMYIHIFVYIVTIYIYIFIHSLIYYSFMYICNTYTHTHIHTYIYIYIYILHMWIYPHTGMVSKNSHHVPMLFMALPDLHRGGRLGPSQGLSSQGLGAGRWCRRVQKPCGVMISSGIILPSILGIIVIQ